MLDRTSFLRTSWRRQTSTMLSRMQFIAKRNWQQTFLFHSLTANWCNAFFSLSSEIMTLQGFLSTIFTSSNESDSAATLTLFAKARFTCATPASSPLNDSRTPAYAQCRTSDLTLLLHFRAKCPDLRQRKHCEFLNAHWLGYNAKL